jgi:hypothetical protein
MARPNFLTHGAQLSVWLSKRLVGGGSGGIHAGQNSTNNNTELKLLDFTQ